MILWYIYPICIPVKLGFPCEIVSEFLCCYTIQWYILDLNTVTPCTELNGVMIQDGGVCWIVLANLRIKRRQEGLVTDLNEHSVVPLSGLFLLWFKFLPWNGGDLNEDKWTIYEADKVLLKFLSSAGSTWSYSSSKLPALMKLPSGFIFCSWIRNWNLMQVVGNSFLVLTFSPITHMSLFII